MLELALTEFAAHVEILCRSIDFLGYFPRLARDSYVWRPKRQFFCLFGSKSRISLGVLDSKRCNRHHRCDLQRRLSQIATLAARQRGKLDTNFILLRWKLVLHSSRATIRVRACRFRQQLIVGRRNSKRYASWTGARQNVYP